MKLTVAVTAASLLLTSGASLAQQSSGHFQPGGYFGVGLANASTSLDGGGQSFDFVNAELKLGYQFHQNFAGELWTSVAVAPKRDDIMSELVEQRVESEYAGYGVFLVASYGAEVYAKARVGLAGSRFTYSASGYLDEDNADHGLAYGGGVGYAKNNLRFELDYIAMPDVDDPIWPDDRYSTNLVSVGITWLFGL